MLLVLVCSKSLPLSKFVCVLHTKMSSVFLESVAVIGCLFSVHEVSVSAYKVGLVSKFDKVCTVHAVKS